MRSNTYVPLLGVVALLAGYVSLLGSGAVPAFASPTSLVGAPELAVAESPMFAPDTVVYGFDDLQTACRSSNLPLPNPYHDLSFPAPALLVPCRTPRGTTGLIPRDATAGVGAVVETVIQLHSKASAVSIEALSTGIRHQPTLVAYDSAGAVVGTSARASGGTTWDVLSVASASANIDHIGLRMPQWEVYLDNLTLVYVVDPTTADDCRNGGWATYGFTNQGQCLRFVQTGQDSRGGRGGGPGLS